MFTEMRVLHQPSEDDHLVRFVYCARLTSTLIYKHHLLHSILIALKEIISGSGVRNELSYS